MEKILLYPKAVALLLSIVTGFFGGLIPHAANRFYSAQEIAAFTAASEAAYPDGMIIAIGGKFDSDDAFRPILERSLAHVGKAHPHMLYVPTAGYDNYGGTDPITTRFSLAGCETDVLLVSKETAQAAAEKFAWADIVYAEGGNLKFLTENWAEKGVYEAADAALKRGAVLMGFSSGAMCWCRHGYDNCGKDGRFMFLDALGFIPYVMCPHFEDWPEFLENVALVTDLDGMNESGGAVTLMTLHSAKGLEFDYVFLAGMEEGIFPTTRALSSAA